MSGGSFNYLCHADARSIFERQEDLEHMADALAGDGYKDAAKETFSLMYELRRAEAHIETLIDRLSNVWHAVEWNRSGDSGPDAIAEAIQRYRELTTEKERGK